MRFALSLALALIVALSSVTMATARHQVRASGEVMLCSGIGVIAVQVDDRGNPVGPMLPCPDCTPSLAALDAVPASVPGPALRLLPVAHALGAHPAPHPRSAAFHIARAPPARV